MRKILALLFIIFIFVFTACDKSGVLDGSSSTDLSGGITGGGSYGGGGGGGNGGGQAGVVTAGEWNDLNNWNFWKELLQRDTIKTFPGVWGFYVNNRVTVVLKDAAGKLLHDAKIKMSYNGNSFTSHTDNFGKAELFASLYQPAFILSDFSLQAEYGGQTFDLGSYTAPQATITATIPVNKIQKNTLDIAFIVDATGSMGDELNYLKNELKDVINRAGNQLPGMNIRMASVYYRDNGDTYVTKPFEFTTNVNSLSTFISAQNADGGGDFPEAVDQALAAANNLQWSNAAMNRIAFLILDAPPHNNVSEMNRLKDAVTAFQQKGIRIIPISASGIDRETEFLLRFLGISTNSTYVFITNDSGVGNPHLTPTVGNYTVEYLNNLMVRLITKYGENHD